MRNRLLRFLSVFRGIRNSGLYFPKKKITSVIADESAPKSADLYIRSVRFSPDGKLIATGAEDHKIRVCVFDGRLLAFGVELMILCFVFWQKKNRFGRLPRNGFFTFSMDTNKKFIPLISRMMAVISFQVQGTRQCVYGI